MLNMSIVRETCVRKSSLVLIALLDPVICEVEARIVNNLGTLHS